MENCEKLFNNLTLQAENYAKIPTISQFIIIALWTNFRDEYVCIYFFISPSIMCIPLLMAIHSEKLATLALQHLRAWEFAQTFPHISRVMLYMLCRKTIGYHVDSARLCCYSISEIKISLAINPISRWGKTQLSTLRYQFRWLKARVRLF